ncbi:MAG: hypothetical protein RSA53_11705 [Odoribacter sp.]
MIDLKLLELEIESVNDKILFNELITCYENKLYRAGYLLAWIMLIESLKQKIIGLADIEDKRSKIEWAKIEALERTHKSTDVQIIESAKECEIISDFEHTTINALWQQRCLFAHPYMQNTTEIDLEYIINKLIDTTFSKPLFFTQKMIEGFLDELIRAPHLIPNIKDQQKLFIEQKLMFIREKHYSALYKMLFFRLSTAYSASNGKITSFMRFFIIELFSKDNVDFNDPSFTIEKQLSAYPTICWIIFNTAITWNKLQTKYRDILFRYFEQLEPNNIKETLLMVNHLLSTNKDIDLHYKNVYYIKLTNFPITSSYSLYLDKSILIERIWEEQIKDWNFGKQMQFIDFLDSLNAPLSEYFNTEQSEKLGSFLGLCCCNNTYSAISFAKAKKDTWISNKYFCKGFILALLVNKGKPQVSYNGFSCLLAVMADCSSQLNSEIMNDLELVFKEQHTHNEYNSEKIKDILKSNKDTFPDKPLFERLALLITNYFN